LKIENRERPGLSPEFSILNSQFSIPNSDRYAVRLVSFIRAALPFRLRRK
jgi:hypothetical protein